MTNRLVFEKTISDDFQGFVRRELGESTAAR